MSARRVDTRPATPAVWGGDALNPLYRAVLVAAASMMPDRTLTGRGLERQPSDNIEMLIRFSRDPQVIKETRLDAVAGLVGLMDEAVAQAPALDLPVLGICYGMQTMAAS